MNIVKTTALAAIAGLAVAAGASAATSATPTFPQFAGPPSKDNPVAKPPEIVYSGDGSHLFGGAKGNRKIGKIHWTTWNGTEGLASANNWINNCDPSCANGKFTLYPVTLKATAPKKEGKYYFFTRLKVTYTHKKFGPKQSFTWPVSYSHGFFDIG
jgi:hypothetical protein